MRIYIIGNDGITLCHEAPATMAEGEIAVASKDELHAVPLSGKRLLGQLAVDDRCSLVYSLVPRRMRLLSPSAGQVRPTLRRRGLDSNL